MTAKGIDWVFDGLMGVLRGIIYEALRFLFSFIDGAPSVDRVGFDLFGTAPRPAPPTPSSLASPVSIFSSFTEFSHVSRASNKFYPVLPSVTEFYWVLPSFTGFFQGFSSVLLGFTRFLQGFIGFY